MGRLFAFCSSLGGVFKKVATMFMVSGLFVYSCSTIASKNADQKIQDNKTVLMNDTFKDQQQQEDPQLLSMQQQFVIKKDFVCFDWKNCGEILKSLRETSVKSNICRCEICVKSMSSWIGTLLLYLNNFLADDFMQKKGAFLHFRDQFLMDVPLEIKKSIELVICPEIENFKNVLRTVFSDFLVCFFGVVELKKNDISQQQKAKLSQIFAKSNIKLQDKQNPDNIGNQMQQQILPNKLEIRGQGNPQEILWDVCFDWSKNLGQLYQFLKQKSVKAIGLCSNKNCIGCSDNRSGWIKFFGNNFNSLLNTENFFTKFVDTYLSQMKEDQQKLIKESVDPLIQDFKKFVGPLFEDFICYIWGKASFLKIQYKEKLNELQALQTSQTLQQIEEVLLKMSLSEEDKAAVRDALKIDPEGLRSVREQLGLKNEDVKVNQDKNQAIQWFLAQNQIETQSQQQQLFQSQKFVEQQDQIGHLQQPSQQQQILKTQQQLDEEDLPSENKSSKPENDPSEITKKK